MKERQALQPLTLESLKRAVVGNAAAIRIVTRLMPAGSSEDKVFPPTYAGGVYAVENRRVGGRDVRCVQLDSVQSQANRFEQALLRAYEDAKLAFPVMAVDFSKATGLEDIGRITTLDAPHRIADAIFRDSRLGGKDFRDSEEGKRYEAATVRRATALYELCPTALIFGTWDSTGGKGGLGNKFARTLVSEIVAFDAAVGVRTSSRIDPLGIEKCELYEDSEGGWTANPDQAKKRFKDKNDKWTFSLDDAKKDEEGQPVHMELIRYGPDGADKGKPSAINHGNVTPDFARYGDKEIDRQRPTPDVLKSSTVRLDYTINSQEGKLSSRSSVESGEEATKAGAIKPGGVTMAYASQTTVLSLPGLRRLRFPDEQGKTSLERDRAAWTVLAALALAAVAHQREHGYDLRSRCHLVPAEAEGVYEVVRSASESDNFILSADRSADLFTAAVKDAEAAGLKWRVDGISLTPGTRLADLVRKGRQVTAQAGE